MLNELLKKIKLEQDGIVFSRLDEDVSDQDWKSALNKFAQYVAEDFISYIYEKYQDSLQQDKSFMEYYKFALDNDWDEGLDGVMDQLGEAARKYAELPQLVKKVRREIIAQKRQGK